ncbi:MAG: hypothetical protein ACYCTH_05825 [Cellulomonas sp.]
MHVLVFTHCDADKKTLFGWIGEACASADVRNTLGAPITSSPGDTWLLAIDGEVLQGFCAITLLKSGKAKLHAFHSELSKKSGQAETALIKEAVNQANKMGAKSISVVDYTERHQVYELQGWKAGVERGKHFRDYSKELEGGK